MISYKYGSVLLNEKLLFMRLKQIYGMVVSKPILPGRKPLLHLFAVDVLICPNRPVGHLFELTEEEVANFALATHKTVAMLGKLFSTSSFTIYTQVGILSERAGSRSHSHPSPNALSHYPAEA